jgi:hypothetical protein
MVFCLVFCLVEDNKKKFMSCMDALSQYAYQYSANPYAPDPRPAPLIFASTNCQGPPMNIVGNAIVVPPSSTVGSFWIPSDWTVSFSDGGTKTKSFGRNNNNNVSVTASNTNSLTYADGTVLYGHIAKISVQPPSQTLTDWKVRRCLDLSYDMIGPENITSYQPASTECDNVMSSWCNHPENATKIECNCLVDEANLQATYCLPGNTSSLCADQTLSSMMPVTCFGKKCSQGGYRWARMLNQRCNITVCQQVISIVGDDIVVKGGSELWCGNRALAPNDVSPTPADDPPDTDTIPIPQWLWLVIIMAVFLVIVVIPVAVIIFRRYYESLNESTQMRFGST